MKYVYILLGAKGSGKTHVGKLIQESLGIPFIHTEKIFMKIKNSGRLSDSFLKEGYSAVEKEIDKVLVNGDAAVTESTGVFPFFGELLSRLKKKYPVKLIRLYAPLEICLERIRKRNKNNHIKMSEQLIKKVYALANSFDYKFVLQIDTSKTTDEEIIRLIKAIL